MKVYYSIAASILCSLAVESYADTEGFPLTTSIWANLQTPVCWENINATPANERAWIQNAVAQTWETHSDVRFTGWGQCQAASTGIHIGVADVGPHTKALGKNLNSVTNGMVLNFTYNNWSPSCQSQRQSCSEKIAVHEFGHALGFAHEQNRSDTPSTCDEPAQGTSGDIFFGAWDLQSVMNYCNPAWNGNGNLSATDSSMVANYYSLFNSVYSVGDNGNDAPNGIGGYDLLDPNDRMFKFDYNNDGKDDLFIYRPGKGAAFVLKSLGDGNFETIYSVGDNGAAAPNGIGGFDLLSTADKAFPFDFNGDGNDDIVLYRPGTGAIFVIQSMGNGNFVPAYAVGDNGAAAPNGIAGYDLLNSADKIIPFDYNGDGKDDLFIYRAGRGAAWVARSNGNGTFTAVYAVGDDGSAGANGIAGYDLLSSSDKVVVFDYNGDNKDDLFFYRPGKGAAWVARSNGDGSFTGVYTVGDDGSAGANGIAGYNLLSTADQVLPFDYNGDGKDDLFLYRPGRGAAWVARSEGDGNFTAIYAVGDDGSAGANGIGGYDLLRANDQVSIFDYNGDHYDDLILYSPGTGATFVVESKGNGTFVPAHAVGDNGADAPNGIGGYNLLSTADRIFPLDYNGDGKDDLVAYRPGKGAVFVMKAR